MEQKARTGDRWPIVFALASLYAAQGIPFGFATEYLPVVLREQGYTYAQIAAVGWLQLPWQLKIFWAKAADSERLRPRTRAIILTMQLALTVTVACFAIRALREAPLLWFALTAVAAALAATQDVFVDAFAVRILAPSERGFGNTAQVAGYRIGMLLGGAALLILVDGVGERQTLLLCAGAVLVASLGAFFGTEHRPAAGVPEPSSTAPAKPRATSVRALAAHMIRGRARDVLVVALTYKLGLHMASSLLKPMAVDHGWSKKDIGAAVVVVGSIGALAGAAFGGIVHRHLKERRALVVALVIHALVVMPLVLVDRLHAPFELTRAVIAFEHFGSGLGTTVLFAALMSATRPSDAGLHYTILTSANAVAIGVGGMIGGFLADQAGRTTAFVFATIVCVLPVVLLVRWDEAAAASRG